MTRVLQIGLLMAALSGCQVTLPPGLVECGDGEACPDGYYCAEANEGENRLCVEGDRRDAGAVDAVGDGVVLVDQGPPDEDAGGMGEDAGPEMDAGPPPLRAIAQLLFGGTAESTVDALVIGDGAEIFVAGTKEAGTLIIGDCTLANTPAGIYVAKLQRVEDALSCSQLVHYAGEADIGGIAWSSTSSTVIVGGAFRGSFADLPTNSDDGNDDAFVLVLNATTLTQQQAYNLATPGDDRVHAVAANGTSACAVGAVGAGLSTGSLVIDPPQDAGGFVACMTGLDEATPNAEVGYLLDEPANDVLLTDEAAWIGWRTNIMGNPQQSATATPLDVTTSTVDSGNSLGFGTSNGTAQHLAMNDMVNGSESIIMVASTGGPMPAVQIGLAIPNPTPSEPLYVEDTNSSLVITDLVVDAVSNVHVVGTYRSPRGPLVDGLPTSDTAFYTTFSIPDNAADSFVRRSGSGSVINALDVADDLVMGGTASNESQFPINFGEVSDPRGFVVVTRSAP